MTRRIYISGPITGVPEAETYFECMAHTLSRVGFEAINPYKIGKSFDKINGGEPVWLDYMRAAIAYMMLCDGLIMLAGWEESRGAKIENGLADALGIPIFYSAEKLCEYFKGDLHGQG